MEFVKSLKHTKLIKYIFIALMGSIILAISSKIRIPFYPVPMTMQTLVILVIGIVGSLYGINHNRDKLLKSSVNLQSDKKQFQELETQLHQQESKIKSLENTFKNEQHQKNHLQKIPH